LGLEAQVNGEFVLFRSLGEILAVIVMLFSPHGHANFFKYFRVTDEE